MVYLLEYLGCRLLHYRKFLPFTLYLTRFLYCLCFLLT
nr:MAG TPA: hypothetical protein [Caudoviricetes sp.]